MKMDVDWAFTCLTNPTQRQEAALTHTCASMADGNA